MINGENEERTEKRLKCALNLSIFLLHLQTETNLIVFCVVLSSFLCTYIFCFFFLVKWRSKCCETFFFALYFYRFPFSFWFLFKNETNERMSKKKKIKRIIIQQLILISLCWFVWNCVFCCQWQKTEIKTNAALPVVLSWHRIRF